jgi:mono/diheme cytochrome c family protein
MISKGKILISCAAAALADAGAWYVLQPFASDVWADPSNRELVQAGETAYRSQCAACHGANLEGAKNWRQRRKDGTFPSPPHDATGHTWHHSDEILFDITKHGGQHNAPSGFVSGMPAFDDKLSDREIYSVLAFIKSRWPQDVRERQEQTNRRSR